MEFLKKIQPLLLYTGAFLVLAFFFNLVWHKLETNEELSRRRRSIALYCLFGAVVLIAGFKWLGQFPGFMQ